MTMIYLLLLFIALCVLFPGAMKVLVVAVITLFVAWTMWAVLL